ncbi:hypothetical protein [Sphaerisporangium sp. TRM90804]|uniref:hypothetical protein n=1 Tax=Sphaerisporangium sp. TRM90804 TaxID=3031113 RepID=UPI00244CC70D|nr:hypothetical protein [Sphaerisporangium sp. TRM90804]MDH2426431.1 hypothetical protein [Sphaerisporangium sp. TRM90804]
MHRYAHEILTALDDAVDYWASESHPLADCPHHTVSAETAWCSQCHDFDRADRARAAYLQLKPMLDPHHHMWPVAGIDTEPAAPPIEARPAARRAGGAK